MREGDGLVIGAWLGLLGVGLGAFGAHALEARLDAEALGWWDTAVRYHLIHAVALVLVGLLARSGACPRWAAWGFLAGICVFSGTLYAMALGAPRWLGAVTPLGGLALMAGWLGLALAGRRSRG